jgi:predicted amidohydrolase
VTPRPGAIEIAVLQTSARPRPWRAALDAVEREVARLAGAGADLVVVPEFAISGYDLRLDYAAVAQESAAPTIERLCATARQCGVTIVTALPRLDADGRLRDASLVVTADGRAHLGAKRYLWGAEREIFEPGPAQGLLVHTAAATVGVAVCYEAGFPETARRLARAGAEVIAVPAAFGLARLHVWELLVRARAVENGCIVAAAGLCEANAAGVRFAGHSAVVGPDGDHRAALQHSPGAGAARIELAEIARARAELPYLADLQRLDHEHAGPGPDPVGRWDGGPDEPAPPRPNVTAR